MTVVGIKCPLTYLQEKVNFLFILSLIKHKTPTFSCTYIYLFTYYFIIYL